MAGSPEILILDDSSSALDYKTDAALRKALREEYQGITTIIIAQRVSSILHADHILVLEEGKELGYGTHQELLRSCQVYQEIAHSQMGVQVASGDRPGPTEPAGETQTPAPGQASEPTPFQPSPVSSPVPVKEVV